MARVIAWFRYQRPKRDFVLITAVLCMLVGSVAVTTALRLETKGEEYFWIGGRRRLLMGDLHKKNEADVWSIERVIFLGGVLMTICGGGLAIGYALQRMRDERFLLVRSDGILRHENGIEVETFWDDVQRVEFELPSTIVFHMRSGVEKRFDDTYFGIDNQELSKLLEDIRRKSVFGLL